MLTRPITRRPAPRMRTHVALAALLVALALLLAACGSSRTAENGSSSDGRDSSGGLAHQTGENDLVLRIETGGGFLPREAYFTQIPQFSLYGDGRLIFTGPVPEIFPGPALPNLREVRLSEEGMQRLLLEAERAGLLEPGRDLGMPPVADAPSTTFTLVTGGGRVVTDAYGLGIESPGDETLTPAQREARQKLMDFQVKLADLPALLQGEMSSDEEYVFPVVRILAQPASDEPDPSGLTPQVLEWPLADPATLGEPEDGGRLLVVTGEDLEKLRPLLAQANTLTRWKSGEAKYLLFPRPLLPDEGR